MAAGAFFAAVLIGSPAAAGPDLIVDELTVNYGLSLMVRDTVDVWRNTMGGLAVGDTQLNKLQVVAGWNGGRYGLPGWKARVQYFRTNGESLSGGRVGDVQTASNIEALGANRIMEAWVERGFGDRGGVRGGLMDLNSDFDSIGPASLFINSSHGIAPDLSKSGLNGPSIFPVSALGVRGAWAVSDRLQLKAAMFDGVPGDLDAPKALAAVRLDRKDGALMIAQADWILGEAGQVSLGAWRYTSAFDRLDRPGERQRGQAGLYAFAQGPMPGAADWSGWVRAGVADPHVSTIASYMGLGVVGSDPFGGHPDDQVGVALGRAALSKGARVGGLPGAETTLELSYRRRVADHLALQPDVQYVIRPASRPGLDNALVVGLRAIVLFKWPTEEPLD